MTIFADKLKIDENRSNPMVVAMQYPDCPINQICFFLVTGFGTVAEQCKYFKTDPKSEIEADCLYIKEKE